MGFFDVPCAESGLVLAADTRLLLVSEVAEHHWEPISIPLVGRYDRAGAIDLPDPLDGNGMAICRFLENCEAEDGSVVSADSLYKFLHEYLTEDSLLWHQRKVSFTLINDSVFTSIADTVALGGKPEWEPYRAGVLEALDFEDLFQKAFAIEEMSRTIYEPLTSERQSWMKPALLELSRCRAWGSSLDRVDIYSDDGGQFTGYSQELNKDGGAEPYCQKSREKYFGYPLVLKAVEDNAAHWQAFDNKR